VTPVERSHLVQTSTMLTCRRSWDHVIYEVDNPEAKLRVPMNKGKEAMSYLTYIIDHYDRLPSTIAFVHSHKDGWPQAWHTGTPLPSVFLPANQHCPSRRQRIQQCRLAQHAQCRLRAEQRLRQSALQR
jgi:hypothetical protein